MPVLHVLAGPNGAGRTTYVRDVLEPVLHLPFINADVIAADRWPGAEATHAYDAALEAERQRRDHMASRRSFITETVFSHESKVALVGDAVALGYVVDLHVVLVPLDLTVERVADRVRRGGHDVPPVKVRDRYERLWRHVAEAIPLADSTTVLDNSSAREPFRVCAAFVRGRSLGPPSWPAWTPAALVGDTGA